MRIIDLSHPISPETPVYPGTEPPVFTTPCTIAADGYAEKRITMFSHTGTHVDAPAHILPHGKTLDQFPVGHFCGRAVVLDFVNGPAVIEPADLRPFEPLIGECDLVILHTGWGRYWGRKAFFHGYPVPSPRAARRLSEFRLKGLGTDAISVDAADAVDFPVHKILLARDIVIIENLTNLNGLAGTPFDFCALPLRIIEADGSPVRAVAFVGAREHIKNSRRAYFRTISEKEG